MLVYQCMTAGHLNITDFNGFERMAEAGESTVEVSIPVALNSDVALECDVLDAKPPPRIKWYNDLNDQIRQSNEVQFLDGERYLYLRRLKAIHLERQYYCAVTSVNLSWEISAPSRYVLIDNLTQGVLIEYKQIGNLIAFVGNASLEFAFVGGVFDNEANRTVNILTVNGNGIPIRLESIGVISTISVPGTVHLEATVNYNSGMIAMRNGTLTIYRKSNHTIIAIFLLSV